MKEVIKQQVRAVSRTGGCPKAGGRKDQSLHSDVNFQFLKMVQVWLTHLFRLVDADTLQPLSDIPSHG